MARPSKFNEERAERIVAALRAGSFLEPAARRAGIAPSTLYEWLERGRAGRAGFGEFLARVEQACADAEVAAVAGIVAAGREHWPAYAWFLERRFPGSWGRRRAEDDPSGRNVTVKLVWPEDADGAEEQK